MTPEPAGDVLLPDEAETRGGDRPAEWQVIIPDTRDVPEEPDDPDIAAVPELGEPAR